VPREDEPRFRVWSTAFIDPGDPATGDFATRRRRREQPIRLKERMMKRFENRTVIVTGAARGMGASYARGFVAEGANVVIADVLEKEGRTLATNLANR